MFESAAQPRDVAPRGRAEQPLVVPAEVGRVLVADALWCGYVIKGPSGVVYFAGDTAAAPHFGQIRERFGPPRLALLPIGAYLPRWFMRAVHVSPDEAVAAHDALGAKTGVGIHFGTFPLADDGETEAVETLRRALPAGREDFWVLDFGEGRDVP